MKPAIAARRLQFIAGPGRFTFHACVEHRIVLGQNDLCKGQSDVMNYYATKDQPVRAVNPDDEIECDFCREG